MIGVMMTLCTLPDIKMGRRVPVLALASRALLVVNLEEDQFTHLALAYESFTAAAGYGGVIVAFAPRSMRFFKTMDGRQTLAFD